MCSYPVSLFIDLFSRMIGLRVSSIIAAALSLSFVIAVVITVVPNINIANALDSNAQTANNTNNFASSHNFGKQTDSSDGEDNSKDGETATSSQRSSPDSILLHFPIPADHNDEIKTKDDGNHEKDNDQNHADKNNNNDNDNSKRKDTSTNTTPLRLPFP
jgi:hypothetical protein